MSSRAIVVAALVAGTATLPFPFLEEPAAASGFYLQEQSVRGLGRANAGEVADSGAASLWWNPAAIGGLERSTAALGATYITSSGRIADSGSTIDRPILAPAPVGGTPLLRDPVQKGVLPVMAAGLRLDDRWAIGLLLASPYGFTTEYAEDGWTRYAGLLSKLRTMHIQPSIAFAPRPDISLGLALNVEHSDARLTNAMPNLSPAAPDGRLDLEGSGWALGWSAGIQYRPTDRLSLGVGFKSAIERRLEGRVRIEGLAGPLAALNRDAEAEAVFSTPWQLSGGLRWQAAPGVTLNLQATRFGWSEFASIEVTGGLTTTLEQNYRDTTSLAAGIDWEASGALTLRAGIQNDPSPTPDAGEPRVPDADRMMYTAGASWRLSDRLTLDAAAVLVDLERGRISQTDVFYAGSAAQTVVQTEGTTAGQRVLMGSAGVRIDF